MVQSPHILYSNQGTLFQSSDKTVTDTEAREMPTNPYCCQGQRKGGTNAQHSCVCCSPVCCVYYVIHIGSMGKQDHSSYSRSTVKWQHGWEESEYVGKDFPKASCHLKKSCRNHVMGMQKRNRKEKRHTNRITITLWRLPGLLTFTGSRIRITTCTAMCVEAKKKMCSWLERISPNRKG